MAYCKSCGSPIKEETKTCPSCGAEVAPIETVTVMPVEEKKSKPCKISFRSTDCSKETLIRTFVVFDKKIIAGLLLTFIFVALAGGVRWMEFKPNLYEMSNVILVSMAVMGVLLGSVFHNRGVIQVGLLFASAVCIVSAVLVFLQADLSTTLLAAHSLVAGFVPLVIFAVCLTLFIEMWTGKRWMGVHCVLLVLSAFSLLAFLIFGLFTVPNGEMGVMITTWQLLCVCQQICKLCTLIFLFSNLGRIGIYSSY